MLTSRSVFTDTKEYYVIYLRSREFTPAASLMYNACSSNLISLCRTIQSVSVTKRKHIKYNLSFILTRFKLTKLRGRASREREIHKQESVETTQHQITF